MARILVTGGRSNYDYRTMEMAILRHTEPDDTIVHGAAAGADLLCEHIALIHGRTTEAHPAEWKVNGVYNPGAGPQRNQRMLDSGIDCALIFSGGRGTKDMRDRLQKSNVHCWDYSNYFNGKRETQC